MCLVSLGLVTRNLVILRLVTLGLVTLGMVTLGLVTLEAGLAKICSIGYLRSSLQLVCSQIGHFECWTVIVMASFRWLTSPQH
jgi:hypothetical protein